MDLARYLEAMALLTLAAVVLIFVTGGDPGAD